MTILTKIPDDVVLTREVFRELLKRNSQARQFGFSKKHTKEIAEIRGANGFKQTNMLYNLPVKWDTEYSYLAS